ncbi:MAG: NADH dehydrogenase [Parcubacteria group bacterium Gr01-1014_106]|nr:MAG: NADH dehydrogenase [Parcubacteria group bacterium Gr01-1014_106]
MTGEGLRMTRDIKSFEMGYRQVRVHSVRSLYASLPSFLYQGLLTGYTREVTQHTPRVVILGGGLGGIRVALWLARHARSSECAITVVDRSAEHVYPPVLYEAATAFNPFEREAVGKVIHETAAVPFAQIFHGSPVTFLQRGVDHIDAKTRTVHFMNGDALSADILVLALGSQLATFGMPDIDAHAFSIKTLPEAAELRHHLVGQFLRHRSASRARQERAFTVTIVGGGSAGVELAAEMAVFLRKLARMHGVDTDVCRVILLDSGEIVLREYPPRLRQRGLVRLRSLGVHVHTRQKVCRIHQDHLECVGGKHFSTDTIVWLAGIRTHDILLHSGLPVHPRGGVYTERTLEVRGHQRIFAAGDCVYAEDPLTARVVPDVAYAAMQQGSVVAQNILRRLRGQPLVSYVDMPRPTFTTVGGKFALVHLPPWQFAGRVGWYLKQLVDLWYLASVLPYDVALRVWWKSVRVRVAND